VPADPPVVLTVRVAGVPIVIEPGLIEHVGVDVDDGSTEQERATDPMNAANALTFTVEVDDSPGLTRLGASPEAASEKSGLRLNTVPKSEALPAVVP